MSEINKRAIPTILMAVLFLMVMFGGSFRLVGESEYTELSGATATPTPTESTSVEIEAPVVSAEPTATPIPTPEPTAEVFNLSFIGDITPDTVAHYRSSSIAYQNVVGDNYAYVFENTKQYFEDDDFTLANFECVLSDEDLVADNKTFTFIAPTAYTEILTEGSVEFVNLGNNHVLDYGEEGYEDTKEAIDAAGIGYAGRDHYSVYETESGLKIGVYGLSFGTVAQVEAGIAALKELEPDFIIAAMHWGDEGSYDVNADQISLGHAAIDAGADVVYGSHSHTLQPIEVYEGKYIFYSLGNWSFGGNTDPRDNDTVIAQLEVTREVDGSVEVTNLNLIPAACSGIEVGNDYRPVIYEEDSEEYLRVLSKLDGTFSGANLTIGYTYTIGELNG